MTGTFNEDEIERLVELKIGHERMERLRNSDYDDERDYKEIRMMKPQNMNMEYYEIVGDIDMTK